MAIVASLVAYASYRLIAAGAAIASRRRVVAAAIAGYLAVNAAALIAAIEFGIQPALFHDARGMPLYAPYPLSIAVPAMMIGHLTLAGVAEAVISAGLVAYLQAADPALLRNTAGALPATEAAAGNRACRNQLAAKIVDRRSSADGAHSARNSGGGKSLGRVVSVGACEAAEPDHRLLPRRAIPLDRRRFLPECSGSLPCGPRRFRPMRRPSSRARGSAIFFPPCSRSAFCC